MRSLETFFIVLGAVLLIFSFWLFKHYTNTPNLKAPKQVPAKSLDTFQFFLARDSATNLLILPPCPPSNPIYMQSIRAIYKMPQLTYDQIRYIRDLQYTFELAMSAYMMSCFNEETLSLAPKFMKDMQVLASEMLAVARRLSLTMQVRFPRECDDPMLTANLIKTKPFKMVKTPRSNAIRTVSPYDRAIDYAGAELN